MGPTPNNLDMDRSGHTVRFGSPAWPPQLRNFGGLLLIAAIQAFLTLGLHCAELIVNTTRDEQVWRGAAKFRQAQGGRSASQGPGASLDFNSIKAACASWQSITLFIVKPITHWLLKRGSSGCVRAMVSSRA